MLYIFQSPFLPFILHKCVRSDFISLGERSPGDCRNCKRIIGNNGDSFRYSYSRLSGWPCGLGHPPLAWLYNLPCDKPYTFRDIGLYPVYIVMLRDPFDRFYAETLHWCTPGSCMDWRTNVDIEKCLLRRRNRHSSRYKVEFDDSCLLEANANVSDRLMIHNRMVKMIGGLVEYFDLNVNGHTVGKEASRWSVKNESNEFMTEIQNRAIELVKRDFNIIILIQEYFEQSLCVLEILYGHLYRFKWDPHSHSHNGEEQKDGQLYGRHDIMKESDAYRKSEAYLIFERKNSYDCQFYNASVDSFHRQFRVVLEFFRRNTTQSSHMKNVPHCIPYL
jgi:hypothetical protein